LSLYFDDQDLAEPEQEPAHDPQIDAMWVEVRKGMEKAGLPMSALHPAFDGEATKTKVYNWLNDEDGRDVRALVKLAMDMQADKQGVPA